MLAESEKSKLLQVTKDSIKRSKTVCLERVAEAIGYEGGKNQENRIEHILWEDGDYKVTVSKPGKEAAPDYNVCKYKDGTRGNNPNDMSPSILLNGEEINSEMKSFTEVFEGLFSLRKNDKALELIACLLFRSAFMADHVTDENGKWVYKPSLEIVKEISNEAPMIKGIPILAFLHYLDAIGLNEDVKYHTLGHIISDGYGRRNNILTCVNLIAVILERYSFAKFVGSFTRPPVGLSPITAKKALELFPYLNSPEV